MYMTLCEKFGLDHYLHRAIMLSPSGTHFHQNWVIRGLGFLNTKVLPKFSKGFRFADWQIIMVERLMSDIRRLPAVRDFVSYFFSQLIGGASYGE